MSWTTDRSIQDNRLLFAVIFVIMVLAAGAGWYVWNRTHARDAAQQPGAQDRTLIQPAFRNETLGISIYYPADGTLVSGTALVKRQPDTQAQAREAIIAVLTDQRAGQAAVLRSIKIRAFYLDARGTAYIDLAPIAQQDIRAAAGEELLAIYALVNTVMQNFEEIKQVAFLMDGREAQTLAGHIDLSRTFTKRMDLVRQ